MLAQAVVLTCLPSQSSARHKLQVILQNLIHPPPPSGDHHQLPRGSSGAADYCCPTATCRFHSTEIPRSKWGLLYYPLADNSILLPFTHFPFPFPTPSLYDSLADISARPFSTYLPSPTSLSPPTALSLYTSIPPWVIPPSRLALQPRRRLQAFNPAQPNAALASPQAYQPPLAKSSQQPTT